MNRVPTNYKGLRYLCKIWVAVAFLFFIQVLLYAKDMAGEPVAIVNGEAITKEDFYERLLQIGAKGVLEQMIGDMLIRQEAMNKGVKATPDEIEEKINLYSEMILTALGAAKALKGNQVGGNFRLASPFYSKATAGNVFNGIGATVNYVPPHLADSAGLFSMNPVVAPIYGTAGVVTLTTFHQGKHYPEPGR